MNPKCPLLSKVRLTLGDVMLWYGKPVRFIKVTPKGFNLLDEITNKCVLKRHLYDQQYSGKPIPHKCQTFHFKVPIRLKLYLSKAI